MTYKLSKYNSFLMRKRRVVGLNLFSGVLFGLTPDDYQLLLDYQFRLEELNLINSTFFSLMCKLGVIQEATENVKDVLLLDNRVNVFSSDHYFLIINPTLNCNFSCWYCYEERHIGMMESSVQESVKKYIYNIVKQSGVKNFLLNWFGGEPLLNWKKVMEPITLFAKKKCEENQVSFAAGITTNGYLVNSDIIDFFASNNFKNIQITLDGNRETHDKNRYLRGKRRGSYDTIVQNIIEIINCMPELIITVRINFTYADFNACSDIISSFPPSVRNRIKILPVQVWQDRKIAPVSIELISQLKERFREEGYLIDKIGFNTKSLCYADRYNQAIINYDGKVYKCTARDFTEENQVGILTKEGEIIWDVDQLSSRFLKATFENSKCLNCKYLPVCFGRCAQQTFIDQNRDKHDKKCMIKKEMKDKITLRLKEFYNSGLKLDYL